MPLDKNSSIFEKIRYSVGTLNSLNFSYCLYQLFRVAAFCCIIFDWTSFFWTSKRLKESDQNQGRKEETRTCNIFLCKSFVPKIQVTQPTSPSTKTSLPSYHSIIQHHIYGNVLNHGNWVKKLSKNVALCLFFPTSLQTPLDTGV